MILNSETLINIHPKTNPAPIIVGVNHLRKAFLSSGELKVKLCNKSYCKTSKIPAKAQATIICINSNLYQTFNFLDYTVRIMTDIKMMYEIIPDKIGAATQDIIIYPSLNQPSVLKDVETQPAPRKAPITA